MLSLTIRQLIADLSVLGIDGIEFARMGYRGAGRIVDLYDLTALFSLMPVESFIFERVFAADEIDLIAEVGSRAEWKEAKHSSHYSPD